MFTALCVGVSCKSNQALYTLLYSTLTSYGLSRYKKNNESSQRTVCDSWAAFCTHYHGSWNNASARWRSKFRQRDGKESRQTGLTPLATAAVTGGAALVPGTAVSVAECTTLLQNEMRVWVIWPPGDRLNRGLIATMLCLWCFLSASIVCYYCLELQLLKTHWGSGFAVTSCWEDHTWEKK